MSEADALYQSIWKTREKIVVFFFTIMIAVTLSATLMYEIENRFFQESSNTSVADISESKFTSIPESMYWAIVTMTTVGYGDVVPQTAAGKAISALLILLGYSLIIVPTGFVTMQWSNNRPAESGAIVCKNCDCRDNRLSANYCHQCGSKLID